jgi:tetratricopeptide (TPR) repeat protein
VVATAGVSVSAPAERVDELETMSRKGVESFGNGKYHQATQWFRKGLEASQRRGDVVREVRFRNAVGLGLLASFNLKGAVSELRQARELALKRSDKETAAAVSVNLSSVLMQSGDLEGAAAYLRAALELASPSSPHRPSLLVQEAYVALQSGNPEAALGILGKALQAARESGDRQSETRSLDIRGNLLLAERRFAEAERDFLEAFRLRRLLGLGL